LRHCCLLSSAWAIAIGVLINEIPTEELEVVDTSIRPFWNGRAFSAGMLPKSDLLRSVRVEELVTSSKQRFSASDRLDLMVESLAIGAMNVNAALKYLLRRNMAVVTEGDRVEMAALEVQLNA